MRLARLATFATAALCLLARPLQAQSTDDAIPSIVRSGLEAVIAGDPERAVLTWSATWNTEARDRAASLTESLKSIQPLLGKAHGYEVVRVFDVSPRIRRLYLVLLFDLQPLYAYFEAYRPADTWQVTSVSWNTDATQVFPDNLLYP